MMGSKGKMFLTTGEAAKYCETTAVAVFKWIKEGKLKACTTPGGRYRIHRKDFEDFLKKYNMPGAAEFVAEVKKKVIIVDDEPAFLKVAAAFFKKKGNLEVETASNGYEALLKIGNFLPDLIILDIKMPKVDGFEVCKKIRQNPLTKGVKIIVVTAYEEEAKKIMACGADQYMLKPIRLNELEKHVSAMLK